MRVIAGSARHILLKTVEGPDTRPTADRIKETLFNMLQYELADTCFLDLFAGSGAIGIEALSRGAEFCVFVEQNPAAVKCIRDNLQATRLEANALVMECDALAALARLEGKYYFDYIFMDPPYHRQLEKEILARLLHSGMIDKQSTVIVEAGLKTDFAEAEEMGFQIEKIKKYKTNQHVFLYRKECR